MSQKEKAAFFLKNISKGKKITSNNVPLEIPPNQTSESANSNNSAQNSFTLLDPRVLLKKTTSNFPILDPKKKENATTFILNIKTERSVSSPKIDLRTSTSFTNPTKDKPDEERKNSFGNNLFLSFIL